jgi:hypothetical protein
VTGELELFLRGVGKYRHVCQFVAWSIAHDRWFCRCGASISVFPL